MTIREQIEKREHEILSPYASFADESRGREIEIEPCEMRTCYQRDRDRILHSRSFRRLKNKTQVFLEPERDHYRTRLTHTLEVSQIARTIAKALQMNEDLTEAIALGHDLGHTPYGHSGEAALDKALKADGFEGFKHYKQSVRLVQKIERDGKGLNLTREVVDGILNHGVPGRAFTLEGRIVRLSDKIAYINHDIDDAIRAGVLTEEMIPMSCRQVLGMSVKVRLDTLVNDVITSSMGKDDIFQSPRIEESMAELRNFMFEQVYQSPVVKHEEAKAQKMLIALYEHYKEHPETIPASYQIFIERGDPLPIVVSDYISGMTDQYAIQKYEEFFVPKGWEY